MSTPLNQKSLTLAVALLLSGSASHAVLIGVSEQLFNPKIAFNSTGVTDYDAGSGVFTLSALPLFTLPDFGSFTDASLSVELLLDGSGNILPAGPPLPTFQLLGVANIDGSTYGVDSSSVLLEGTVVEFGFADAEPVGGTDYFDFIVALTGGFLQPLYPSDAIGIDVISEVSSFSGSFEGDFGGGAKGNIGQLEAVPEPSTYAAIAGLGCLVVALIRRRRR